MFKPNRKEVARGRGKLHSRRLTILAIHSIFFCLWR